MSEPLHQPEVDNLNVASEKSADCDSSIENISKEESLEELIGDDTTFSETVEVSNTSEQKKINEESKDHTDKHGMNSSTLDSDSIEADSTNLSKSENILANNQLLSNADSNTNHSSACEIRQNGDVPIQTPTTPEPPITNTCQQTDVVTTREDTEQTSHEGPLLDLPGALPSVKLLRDMYQQKHLSLPFEEQLEACILCGSVSLPGTEAEQNKHSPFLVDAACLFVENAENKVQPVAKDSKKIERLRKQMSHYQVHSLTARSVSRQFREGLRLATVSITNPTNSSAGLSGNSDSLTSGSTATNGGEISVSSTANS